VTHSELAALELQARIMGWEPAVTENVVIEVGHRHLLVRVPLVHGETVSDDDRDWKCPQCDMPHCECEEY
jgi:hypothetical protein